MCDLVAQLRSVKRNPVGGLCVRAADRIEQLTSGPGGIMEMKQTIADKERRLENVHKAYEKLGHMYNNLIAKNEYAKNEKVLLDWPENYGQGSEPWLNKD